MNELIKPLSNEELFERQWNDEIKTEGLPDLALADKLKKLALAGFLNACDLKDEIIAQKDRKLVEQFNVISTLKIELSARKPLFSRRLLEEKMRRLITLSSAAYEGWNKSDDVVNPMREMKRFLDGECRDYAERGYEGPERPIRKTKEVL